MTTTAITEALAAVTAWHDEIDRLEAQPAVVAASPADLAKASRARAAQQANIDAAQEGLAAVRQHLAEVRRADLHRVADNYERAADKAAALADKANAEFSELHNKVRPHIPARHVINTAAWPDHSALATEHRHTEWLNRRAARCCQLEAEGIHLADYFDGYDEEFISRFGIRLWLGWDPAFRIEDKTICASNLPPEVKALYTDKENS